MPPISLARARAIDLSVQFSLFWMPFLVLLAWWTNKPLSLLFGIYRNLSDCDHGYWRSGTVDLFEVAVLVGACFLVNYITADAKTNWAEGFAMVGFYTMIVSDIVQVPKQFFLSLSRAFVRGTIQVNQRSTCFCVKGPSQLLRMGV
jgi:hypothetical protein